MGKIVILKFTEFQEKILIKAKTAIPFSEASQKHNFTRSYCCVASTPMTCVMSCFSFVVDWLFYDIFLKFLLCEALFHEFLIIKFYRELAQIVLLVSQNANPNTEVVKLHFRGASQNPLAYLP